MPIIVARVLSGRPGRRIAASGASCSRCRDVMASASEELFARAREVRPGGVNSHVRSCRAVGGNPVFVASGDGGYITDVDGRTYVDFVGSWGPLILGHAHPEVIAAVAEYAAAGTSFGAPTALEVDLACLVTDAMPA